MEDKNIDPAVLPEVQPYVRDVKGCTAMSVVKGL